jgi:3-deoxy-D-manno-octulosonate 8-phosphate phosphatase (KDO 8-P phosphatase)
MQSLWQPDAFVLDVDGVMTTGQFAYTADGKAFKVFGPDDHDALLVLKERLNTIHFISGDRKGFEISHRRIAEDMKFPLDLVSTIERVSWISGRWDPAKVIYMGDGILDLPVFAAVGYSICTADGFYLARQQANYVTHHSGGNRAVAEACVHILEKFYAPYDPFSKVRSLKGGEWGKTSG